MKLAGLFVGILVLVAIVALPVVPVHSALAQEPGTADPTRNLPYPGEVERGETFEVLVNFTCPGDDFNAITMRDTAPDGWDVSINTAWSTPPLDDFKKVGNQVQLIWNGPYDVPKNFTARYKVKVPCDASVGKHYFSSIYPNHTLVYHIAGSDKIAENIMGEYNVTVIDPTINFTPASIHFYGAVNGSNPQNQILKLWSSTPCMLNWFLTDDAEWLSESPASGSCTDAHSSVTLSVNSSGISEEGDYPANITIDAPEANNSVEIVPVTLHMSVTDILKVHVSFDGRGTNNSRWVEPFEVWLFNPGTTNVVWEGNRTTNNTGWFNISDVVVGTYDIGIKNWTCLSEVASNVTVSEGAGAVVDFGTTREGDANGDDYITIDDRILLYGGWGSGEGDPNWRPNCDFNRDGYITVDDRILLYNNWNEKGDLAP